MNDFKPRLDELEEQEYIDKRNNQFGWVAIGMMVLGAIIIIIK